MARPELPRSLRRAAARSAGPRTKAPNPRLVAAAHAGLLTTGNTKKGSAGRKAVDAVEYQRRLRRHRDEPPRRALGHRAPEDQTAVWSVIYVDGPHRVLYDAEIARRDVRRVAKHLGFIGALAAAQGPERARATARRIRAVRSWRPLVVLGPPEIAGEVRFLSDPEAALALAEGLRAEEAEVIVSYGRSARRRGRT
jgi:hypothetical protein